MSNTIKPLIPCDPFYTPSITQCGAIKNILPSGAVLETSDKIRFADAGGNFERVRCPFCYADLMEWWMARRKMNVTYWKRWKSLRGLYGASLPHATKVASTAKCGHCKRKDGGMFGAVAPCLISFLLLSVQVNGFAGVRMGVSYTFLAQESRSEARAKAMRKG